MTGRSEKTVYVLGAGFSGPAGGPDQARLLKDIFDLPASDSDMTAARDALEKFLVHTLNVSPAAINDTSLEDVFTPIDRCLSDGVALRGVSPESLRVLRGQLEYLISIAINDRFESRPREAKQYVRNFAHHIVQLAAGRAARAVGTANAAKARAYDPVSIISMNWDMLLDSSLHSEVGDLGGWRGGDYDAVGVVDYCCYINSVNEHEPRIYPGLWALGTRGFNVKLLKIHGSMNWLQCSNCQRLFVSFEEKISILSRSSAQTCRHCLRHDVPAMLERALVMPTFLKDLTNFQIKLVWQNAGVELMEATKIVFIGYSLPHADFEFRQLLSRMVHKNAAVHVVLYEGTTDEQQRKYAAEKMRYQQFFSGHTPTFEPAGVEKFVAELR